MLSRANSLPYELLLGVLVRIRCLRNFGGRLNKFLATHAGEAARVLGHEDLVVEFERLLATLTPEEYWSGALTNIDLPTTLSSDLLRIHSYDEVVLKYPEFPEDYFSQLVPDKIYDSPHLAPCIEGNFAEAFSLADGEFPKEEVALAQALGSDPISAMAWCSKLAEPSRKNHVGLVVLIEVWRRGRAGNEKKIRDLSGCWPEDDYSAVHFALGASNRIPWVGYPFPDY